MEIQASGITEVIVEGRSGDLKEPGQLRPVLREVRDRLAEAGVGFDAMLVELCRQPRVQRLHQRTTVHLMEREPGLR